MAGSRKFRTDLLSRDDLGALTHEAAAVSGISYVMDVDKAEVATILDGKSKNGKLTHGKPAPAKRTARRR